MIVNNCGHILRWSLCWEMFCSGSNNFLLHKEKLWTHWLGIDFISVLLLAFSKSDKEWFWGGGWSRISCRIMTLRTSGFPKTKKHQSVKSPKHEKLTFYKWLANDIERVQVTLWGYHYLARAMIGVPRKVVKQKIEQSSQGRKRNN